MKDQVTLIHASTFSSPKEKVDCWPWGALYLSAGLILEGIEAEIIDLNVEKICREKILHSAIVGISTTTYAVKSALYAASEVRKINPAVPIIWGGVHPTLDPLTTVEHSLADAVFCGEGDLVFPKICKQILDGEKLPEIQGLTTKFYQAEKPVFHTVTDLDLLPDLPYHLLDINRYNPAILEVHTGRGCTSRCGFCYNAWRKHRIRNPEKVVHDILRQRAIKINPKILVFNDDQFFANENFVSRICEGLIENNIGIPWAANCRIDYIANAAEDFLVFLRKSQCSLLKMGVESGSQIIQKLIGKGGIDRMSVLYALERCKKHGLGVKLNFIIGFPGETEKDLEDTAKLIAECAERYPAISRIALGVYDPYPGTPLWALALKNNYDAPGKLDDWGLWHGEISRMKWLSKRTREIIRNMLFLSIPLDKPYANTIKGLWSRQPSRDDFLWRAWNSFLSRDMLWRFRNGYLRLVPERFLYEMNYGKIGLVAPQSR